MAPKVQSNCARSSSMDGGPGWSRSCGSIHLFSSTNHDETDGRNRWIRNDPQLDGRVFPSRTRSGMFGRARRSAIAWPGGRVRKVLLDLGPELRISCGWAPSGQVTVRVNPKSIRIPAPSNRSPPDTFLSLQKPPKETCWRVLVWI